MAARGKRTAGLIVLVFVATIIIWLFSRRTEPVYDGKPLSAWAQQYGSTNWTRRKELRQEAQFAIREIGTNAAIPFLIDLMSARDSGLKKRLRKHVPKKWHDPLRLTDNSGKVRRIGAHGLAALGSNAPTAVRH